MRNITAVLKRSQALGVRPSVGERHESSFSGAPSCLRGESLDAFPCVRRESGDLARLEKTVRVDRGKQPEHSRPARIVEGSPEFVVALA